MNESCRTLEDRSAHLCQEYLRVDLDYALDLLEVITLQQALLSRDAVTEDLPSRVATGAFTSETALPFLWLAQLFTFAF